MSTHVRSQEEIAARVKALESILIEKGIMTTAAVDRLVEIYENEVGPKLGALVRAELETHGVEVLTGTTVRAITRAGTGDAGRLQVHAITAGGAAVTRQEDMVLVVVGVAVGAADPRPARQRLERPQPVGVDLGAPEGEGVQAGQRGHVGEPRRTDAAAAQGQPPQRRHRWWRGRRR